jgi:hypothetical protein
MNVFTSSASAILKADEASQCRCGARPLLVRKMMDSRNGMTVRMFECQCGQRTWTELKE